MASAIHDSKMIRTRSNLDRQDFISIDLHPILKFVSYTRSVKQIGMRASIIDYEHRTFEHLKLILSCRFYAHPTCSNIVKQAINYTLMHSKQYVPLSRLLIAL